MPAQRQGEIWPAKRQTILRILRRRAGAVWLRGNQPERTQHGQAATKAKRVLTHFSVGSSPSAHCRKVLKVRTDDGPQERRHGFHRSWLDPHSNLLPSAEEATPPPSPATGIIQVANWAARRPISARIRRSENPARVDGFIEILGSLRYDQFTAIC